MSSSKSNGHMVAGCSKDCEKRVNNNLTGGPNYPAPFSSDAFCKELRKNCDYTRKITIEEAKNGTAPRRVRIYADGVYDMFHAGHARQLMQTKILIPNCYLIVGITSDKMTHELKGKTVMTDTERYEAVRHCRYVDEIVRDAPWFLDEQFLDENKIDFVAHDEAPYGSAGADDVYKFVKDKGMFLPTERTEGISTSDLVARIVKDYDLYVRRNLARGYSAKDLNVGFFKAKRYKIQNSIDEIKERGKSLLNKWEDESREMVSNFLKLFDSKGKIGKIWAAGKAGVQRALSPPPSPEGARKRYVDYYESEEEDEDSDISDTYEIAESNLKTPVKANSSPGNKRRRIMK